MLQPILVVQMHVLSLLTTIRWIWILLFLRIATELPLKRLIVGGLEGVYEIGRCSVMKVCMPRITENYSNGRSLTLHILYGGMMDLTERFALKSVAMEF